MFDTLFSTTSTKTKPKTKMFEGIFNTPIKETAVITPNKTGDLPNFLGGGSYNLGDNGSLATSTRGYAGVEAPGEYREHIFPVALGGTSNFDNIKVYGKELGSKKSDYENQIIDQYKKGKIDLGEARGLVLKKYRELTGMDPKQGTAAYLPEAIKETIAKPFQFFGNLFNKAKEKIQEYAQPVAGEGKIKDVRAIDILRETRDVVKSGLAPTPEEIQLAKESKTGTYLTKNGTLLTVDKKTGKYSQLDVTAGVGSMKDVAKEGLDLIGEQLLKNIKNKVFKNVAEVAESTGKKIFPEVFKRTAQSLNPIVHQEQPVQNAFKTWTRELLVGEEAANKQIAKIPQLADNFDTILKYEQGVETPNSKVIKENFDELFKKAEQAGMDIPYRQNYVPQVYNNTSEEVQTAMARFMEDRGVPGNVVQEYISGIEELPENISKTLKLNPFFSKERAFPNYKTAMEYGLTPKFTEPAQLLANYDAELSKTIANRKFIDELLRTNQISTVEKAGQNWEALSLPFSPKGYYAPPDLAKMLNGMFRNEELLGATETAVKGVSNLSKTMQEVVLSAGIPKTSVNFFAIGQLVKNLTAGDIKAVPAFIRSNFKAPTIKFFTENGKYLEGMADQGINILERPDKYSNIYKKLSDVKGLGKKIGFIWDKAFNENTFKSFLPQMQVNTFKDIYDKAIVKMSDIEAKKLAGDTVKAFYGLHESLGRGKGTEDVLSATFFAPKFREGIINTLMNTARSVTSEIRNPAFRNNRKLLAGMITSFAGYNALNKKLTGHYMWENPDGKEFDLMIPTKMGNTKDDVVYIGFMPSFLSFARNMASGGIALVKGDTSTAKQKIGSLFSMPIKLSSEIWANKDYFGRKIYEDYDDRKTKLKKIANYTFLSVNHPFVKEIYNQLTTDKPLYQSVSEAMELPFKFSSYSKIQKQEFYDAIRKKDTEEAKVKDNFRPKYTEVRSLLDSGKVEEAKNMVDSLSDGEYKLYSSLKRADKTRGNVDKEIQIFNEYKDVQEFIANGDEQSAKDMVDSMTDDEYKAYIRLKAKLQ